MMNEDMALVREYAAHRSEVAFETLVARHISLVYSAAVNDQFNRVAGYTTYDAHVTWQAPKANWQVTVQALNFTDKHYYSSIFDLVEAGQGTVGAVPGRPLEVDLEIKHQL